MEKVLTDQQVSYCDYTKEWGLYILPTKHTPTAVLFQSNPLLWIHLPVSPARALTTYYDLVATLIAAGRTDSNQLLG